LDSVVKAESDEPHAWNAHQPRVNIFALARGHALARDAMPRQPSDLDFGRQDDDAARRHVEKFRGLGASTLQECECARF
jgi:hypothetical protein